MIARHHRDNHERVDAALYQVQGLIEALEAAYDEHRGLGGNDRASRVIRVLRDQAEAALEKVQRAHDMEWIGVGGRSDNLTEAEIAEASAKTTEVAA